ncbi:TonB-dependent receptor [Phenylobacterium hankyongense]|uniref:TonB-dependent receptor n=1 Tax=Phenylobacterium hankyongense TaxID=1813876 RepID=A0A328AZK1_9CAUL|nr:TonB-dependent receptor [Phenylobacterium hankyongense]RAK60572.1 TonB-dependent receptor [Phenylobacterium hankyongense]
MRMVSAASAMLAGVSMLALAAPALAQSSGVKTFSAADKASGGDAGGGEAAEVEAVVVTGSRIVSNGFQAPTPVTTMTSEALLARAPTNIPDALNQLPQFRGSSSNKQSVTWNANSPNQGNYLNLRGLGTTRTLILLDGVRVPPTSFAGGVDINTLPQVLVQRVDVVTGGASAAYGSDAMVGVVNFVLDKNFNGLKGSAQYGASTYGDANSYKATLAAGTSFAGGRGHIEGSIEHFNSDPINANDRENGQRFIQYTSRSQGGVQYSTTYQDVRFSSVTFGGYINSGPLKGYEFLPGGAIQPMAVGGPTTNPTYSIGGGGAYWTNTTMVSALKTDQAFGRVSYDLTDNINSHMQFSAAESRNQLNIRWDEHYGGSQNGITISRDNAFLRPEVVAALGSTNSFQMSRIGMMDTPQYKGDTLNDSGMINAGLDGKFSALGHEWHWDANYVWGRNQLRTNVNEFNSQRFYAAIDSVRNSAGQAVCRVSLTNPTLLPGCVPMNIFGVGAPSAESIAWAMGRSQYQAVNQMNIVSANLSGDLFELPAGPLSVAFGGEWRRQTLDETSNSDPAVASSIDYTGIQGKPNNVLPYNFTNIGLASGQVTVKEAYVEVAAPLLKDLPFVQSLDLNAAARVTDYSTSGQVMTWKVGVNYQPYDDLRLRMTVSRDITAPTLYQLYQGKQVTANLDLDLHTGASASYINEVGGNPNLTPEIGSMVVGGFVYSPSYFKGFTVSVDAYSLLINDAIGSTNQGLLNQECEQSNGTSPSCAYIIRPLPFSDRTPANNMQRVLNVQRNQAKVFQSGFDVEAAYLVPLEAISSRLSGRLELRGLASVLTDYSLKPSATQPRQGQLNYGNNPRISGSLEANYSNGPWSVRVAERWTGSAKRSRTTIFTNYDVQPNVNYTDLNVAYKFGAERQYEAFASVQNLFNVDPPLIADSANPGLQFPTNRAMYDVIGRYITVGFRFRR